MYNELQRSSGTIDQQLLDVSSCSGCFRLSTKPTSGRVLSFIYIYIFIYFFIHGIICKNIFDFMFFIHSNKNAFWGESCSPSWVISITYINNRSKNFLWYEIFIWLFRVCQVSTCIFMANVTTKVSEACWGICIQSDIKKAQLMINKVCTIRWKARNPHISTYL